MRNELRVYDKISDAIGWTPMVRLSRALPDTGCDVYAKLEFLNPMGSTKDRIARHFIQQALTSMKLEAGGTVVEASSGNTAMGLAMMGILEDVCVEIVVRKETSPEKLACLRALGAKLILVDGDRSPDDPESFNRKAAIVADATPGAWFPDQHNNRANNDAHYSTTGPEIWEQMEGRVDVLVAGIGTGGTLSGTARYLKERNPALRVVAVDGEGSVFTEYFRTGSHGASRPQLLEGLGDDEIIGCPDFDVFDDMIQVSDRDAFVCARELARTEAMFAGGSSGAALSAVRQVVRTAPESSRIVTIFSDAGARYLSTIYDDDWMRNKGFI